MLHKINYGDNIFFITLKVKTLIDCLKLDLDKELFYNHIFEDILFIAETQQIFFDELKESSLILNKLEYLKSLQRLSIKLDELLTLVLDENMPHYEYFSRYKEQIIHLKDKIDGTLDIITKSIHELNHKSTDDEHIVSEEEYRFLFSSDDKT